MWMKFKCFIYSAGNKVEKKNANWINNTCRGGNDDWINTCRGGNLIHQYSSID